MKHKRRHKVSQKVYAKWHDIQLKNGGEKKELKTCVSEQQKKRSKAKTR